MTELIKLGDIAIHVTRKAIKNVHLEKGTLLESKGLVLSEGSWPAQAYADAVELRLVNAQRPRSGDRREFESTSALPAHINHTRLALGGEHAATRAW